jgi:hypothetical protein
MSTKQRFLNRLRLLASALNPFPHASGYQFVLGQVPQTAEEQLEHFFRRFEILPLELQYFITDFMLRRCVMVVSEYVIYAAGFDTRLESTAPPPPDTDAKTYDETLLKQYGWIKDFVDGVNKQVNLDDIIFSAALQMCLYGRAAFEIVRDTQGVPVRLNVLPVHPDHAETLKPIIDKHTGRLVKFTLKTRNGDITYRPEEILYFVNTDLDSTYYGLSDVTPALPACIIRRELVKTSPRIVKRTSDPYVIVSVNTLGFEGTKAELTQSLNEIARGMDSGENIVTNHDIKAEAIYLNINLENVTQYDKERGNEIAITLGVPRVLVNEPNINRATSETEIKAFVGGRVAFKQRYIKRVLESKVWYGMLVRLAFELKGTQIGENQDAPVSLKQNFRVPDIGNLVEQADIASKLYGNGLGPLGVSAEQSLKLAKLWTPEVEVCFQTQTQTPQPQ